MSINKKLQKQLKAMADLDQKMRTRGKWNKKIDLENIKKLKNIIKKYGWPDVELVGKKTSHLAWLITQHADHDIRFQKKCLELLKEKLKKNKVDIEVAYLTDRTRVNQGKKQIYGTQFYLNKSSKLVPRPIYNKEDLNKRRKKVGLEKFEKYKKKIVNKTI